MRAGFVAIKLVISSVRREGWTTSAPTKLSSTGRAPFETLSLKMFRQSHNTLAHWLHVEIHPGNNTRVLCDEAATSSGARISGRSTQQARRDERAVSEAG